MTPRTTPLHSSHLALGARMIDFGGWDMPVYYAGINEEHRAVRTTAGVFDVSHMGQVDISGQGAEDFLQRMLSNDLGRIGDGQAQYTLLTNDAGGIVDDLIAYRRGPDDFLLVVNAANVEADVAVLAAAADGVSVVDRSAEHGMIALQGPTSDDVLDGAAGRHPAVRVRRAGRGGRPVRGGAHGLHRRARRRDRHARRRHARRLGAPPGARRGAVRARRARHAPARGLLPAPRQRHHADHQRDRGRARLGLRAPEGLHRRAGAAPDEGGGPGPAPRGLPDDGARDPARRDGDPRRRGRLDRRRHQRHAEPEHGRGDRDGIRRERPRRRGNGARDRCARPPARRGRRRQASATKKES